MAQVSLRSVEGENIIVDQVFFILFLLHLDTFIIDYLFGHVIYQRIVTFFKALDLKSEKCHVL